MIYTDEEFKEEALVFWNKNWKYLNENYPFDIESMAYDYVRKNKEFKSFYLELARAKIALTEAIIAAGTTNTPKWTNILVSQANVAPKPATADPNAGAATKNATQATRNGTISLSP